MKKVLIITYYWPPSGGAGVQRWLKFAKYLRYFGWEPVIYTPLNPGFSLIDETLQADIPEGIEVIKTAIWEPYGFYKKITGQKSTSIINTGFLTHKEPVGIIERLSIWVRGNLFIPDARKFWIKPSAKFLVNYLKIHPVDALVSTGPPHSMHMIALKVSERLNIPWLADFRDPWTDFDFYKDMKITAWADRKHKKLEFETFTRCSAMVVVSHDMKVNYEKMGGHNVHLITNGYDPDDIDQGIVLMDSKFTISHIGSLPPNRNPKLLWRALSELCELRPAFRNDLEIKLVGQVDNAVFDDLTRFNLIGQLNHIRYVPHNQVSILMKQSAVLLLAINNSSNAKGILTGKFFEYMASGRPILAIGPKSGDVSQILFESGAGEIVDYDENQRIVEVIGRMYEKYLNNDLVISTEGIEKYSRKNLTAELTSILNSIIQ